MVHYAEKWVCHTKNWAQKLLSSRLCDVIVLTSRGKSYLLGVPCSSPTAALPHEQKRKTMTEQTLQQEQVKAFIQLQRRCGPYRFPPDRVLRHFPPSFVLAFAERALASSKWCRDVELLYFVARVLRRYTDEQSSEQMDSVLARLYLAVFSSPEGPDVFGGQAWEIFDAYAEECLGDSFHTVISTGTDDEKLNRMKVLVRARRGKDYALPEPETPLSSLFCSTSKQDDAPPSSFVFSSSSSPAMFNCSTPLSVKRLSENAVLPTRGSEFAAGYDLASAHDAEVPARGRLLVKTDLAIAIPPGTYGRVAPRSGLAVKHGIGVGAGVIDYDYRGNVGVVLFNHSDTNFVIQRGDRIAQLVLEQIAMTEVQEVDELPETTRGTDGFGSTGM